MVIRLLLTLYFFSGALALGYQVIWSKVLLNVIGVSAWSYAVVLASFMAGLTLGSRWIGRAADRVDRPLALFAWLELGVSVLAVCFPSLIDAAADFYVRTVQYSPDHAGQQAGLGIKSLICGLLILPPTILMGGTFPAMMRAISRTNAEIGTRCAEMYGVNALGAAGGALAAAFGLIPALGLSGSASLLAVGNAAIGLTALVAANRIPTRQTGDEGGTGESAVGRQDEGERGGGGEEARGRGGEGAKGRGGDGSTELATGGGRTLLILIFLEGALAFLYEIGWTRFFSLVLGSSTYSFAVMLFAFIFGTGLGSILLSLWPRPIASPLRVFGWTQILTGIAVFAAIPFYPFVPWLFSRFGTRFNPDMDGFQLLQLGKILFCFGVMLIPAVLIGMAVPLVIRELARSIRRLGADSGRVYAASALGNVCGALIGGYLLLSALGMERLLRWSALGSGALGLAALACAARESSGVRRTPKLAIAVCAALLAAHLAIGPWNPAWFTLVPFRRIYKPQDWSETVKRVERAHVPVFHDDPAGHLMVSYTADTHLTLFVNGKPDASSYGDMATQYLLAHVPLILHPAPRDVCVIGLASGITAGAALTHPVRRVDAVEIMESMPRATKLFNRWNGDPFRDPRFTLIIDDARSYLRHTRQTYDVIVSEPSNPWMAGVGLLFSTEFYDSVKDKLNPGGVFLQWVQGYELGDELFAATLRGFRLAFPYVYAFQGNGPDYLLLGSREPLKPERDAILARMSGAAGEQLQALNIRSPEDFLFLQRFSPATADYIASLTALENTADNLLLETHAPIHLHLLKWLSIPGTLDERLTAAGSHFYFQSVGRGEAASQESTLRMLTGNDIRIDPVLAGFRGAVRSLRGEYSDTAADMPPIEELARAIAADVARGDAQGAARRIEPHRAAILISAALNGRRAEFWIAQTENWLARMPRPEADPLRRFYLDLLIASGHKLDAHRFLARWLKDEQPPAPEYAVVRGGQIHPELVRHDVIRFYLAHPHPDWLDRLAESLGLTAAGPLN